jgi:hypothetical protein
MSGVFQRPHCTAALVPTVPRARPTQLLRGTVPCFPGGALNSGQSNSGGNPPSNPESNGQSYLGSNEDGNPRSYTGRNGPTNPERNGWSNG